MTQGKSLEVDAALRLDPRLERVLHLGHLADEIGIIANLGFGIAAILTGALIAMGLSVGLAQLLLIYAILSLISWLLLRRFLQPKSGSVKTFDQDIND